MAYGPVATQPRFRSPLQSPAATLHCFRSLVSRCPTRPTRQVSIYCHVASSVPCCHVALLFGLVYICKQVSIFSRTALLDWLYKEA